MVYCGGALVIKCEIFHVGYWGRQENGQVYYLNYDNHNLCISLQISILFNFNFGKGFRNSEV
jgi:hypothetical protein